MERQGIWRSWYSRGYCGLLILRREKHFVHLMRVNRRLYLAQIEMKLVCSPFAIKGFSHSKFSWCSLAALHWRVCSSISGEWSELQLEEDTFRKCWKPICLPVTIFGPSCHQDAGRTTHQEKLSNRQWMQVSQHAVSRRSSSSHGPADE